MDSFGVGSISGHLERAGDQAGLFRSLGQVFETRSFAGADLSHEATSNQGCMTWTSLARPDPDSRWLSLISLAASGEQKAGVIVAFLMCCAADRKEKPSLQGCQDIVRSRHLISRSLPLQRFWRISSSHNISNGNSKEKREHLEEDKKADDVKERIIENVQDAHLECSDLCVTDTEQRTDR